jgi:hypothetical protein
MEQMRSWQAQAMPSAKLLREMTGVNQAARTAMEQMRSVHEQSMSSARLFRETTGLGAAALAQMKNWQEQVAASSKLFREAATAGAGARAVLEQLQQWQASAMPSATLMRELLGVEAGYPGSTETLAAFHRSASFGGAILKNVQPGLLPSAFTRWTAELGELAESVDDEPEDDDFAEAAAIVGGITATTEIADLAARIDLLLAEVQQHQNPRVRKVIKSYLWEMIRNVIYNVIASLLLLQLLSAPTETKIIEIRHTEVVREVRKSARDVFMTMGSPSDYRVVARDTLVAHYGPRQSSLASGTLKAGRVVFVLEKRREWTLVLWSLGESSEVREGWVKSKNLKSLERGK